MVPSHSDFEAAIPLEIYINSGEPSFYSATVKDRIFVFLAITNALWVCKELATIIDLINFEQGLFDGKDLFLSKEGDLFLWKSYSKSLAKTWVIAIDIDEVAKNKWHTPEGSFFNIRKL